MRMGVLMESAARVLHDRFGERMAAAGYVHSLTASKIMGSLTKEGVRLSDLADRLGITKQSVGQVVDDLEADGFVRRNPDPDDGRAKRIVIGPRGREALPVAWQALRESDDLARQVLGDDGVTALRDALERLLAEPDRGA
jgi:DNA-binding MarR family transcriptional regulator